jgi:exopolyphosphatase/guanosine-5'-triphosphate,3'-diphosphate pyrophosphatase
VKFAAIDIGSNAVRLLIGNVVEVDGISSVKKISLTRVPIRLGEDVFSKQKVSKEKVRMLIKTLKAYKHLMDVYKVAEYRACATSAMREAENGKAIIKQIKEETGIKLEIIDGEMEAELILSTFFIQKFDLKRSYLYIDVGGGSTEVSLIKKGKKVASRSFRIGTVRILENDVPKKRWEEMKSWVKSLNPGKEPFTAIGTGGNINRILKLNRGKEDNLISYVEIKAVQGYVKAFSYEDRMDKLGMRSDRADVIIPAADIYLSVMRYSNTDEMIVPKIGLSDGIIYSLYQKHVLKEA